MGSRSAQEIEISDYDKKERMEMLDNIQPGEVLLEEFMEPLKIPRNSGYDFKMTMASKKN